MIKTSEQMGEAYDKLKEKGAYFSLGENYLDEIFKCDIVFRTRECITTIQN